MRPEPALVLERFPFANLVDGVWRTDGSAEAIERRIRTGHNPMPGFEGRLTEEEIHRTVAYVLALPQRAEAAKIARPDDR
jgi:mono/diheme cytochrome c family protein